MGVSGDRGASLDERDQRIELAGATAMEELDVSRETMEGSKLDIIVGYGEFLIG